MDCTGQGNDIELIPTVKMEIRHPAKRSFGSEFLSICNHCSYGNLKSKTWKKVPTFCVFFWTKWPLTVKCSKFCSKRIHRTQSAADFIGFGSLSAELYPNMSTPSEHAQSERNIFEPNN